MEGKGAAHAHDLQPAGIAVDIAAVGVVRLAVGDHADRRVRAEIRPLKTRLRPAGVVAVYHDGGGVVHGAELVRGLDAQHEVARHLGIIEGRVA